MNFDRIRELVWEQTFQSSKLSSVLVMLEEVGKFISGRTPKSDELASIGDIPYFKVGDMNTEGNEKVLRITSLFLKEKAGKTFPAGAIVYPKNGGAVFTNKRRILATESVIDLNTGGFVCGERLNQAYTYMFFCGLDFRKISKGTALPTIDQKKLHQTKIPVPSLEEQSRIVTRLGEAFAEIDRAEKAYEELQTLAGVLRGQILQKAIQGKLVPQRAEEGVVEQIGAAPEEVPFVIPGSWKWCVLRGLVTPTKQKVPDERFTYIDVASIDGFKITNTKTLEAQDAPSRARKIVKDGMLLYSTVRPYLKKISIASGIEGDVIASTAFATFACSEKIYNRYLFYVLVSEYMNAYVKSVQKGVAYPAINDRDFYSVYIPVPPMTEQVRIVARLEELLKQVDKIRS